MTSLEVEFAGLKLRNPVIAASAPPTESLESIVKCAEAGAGAVVSKSCANFDASKFILGGRRTYVDRSGLWAQGTFRHETLTISEGVDLVSKAVRVVDIPVIASVGSLSLDPQDWLDSCLAMQDAGASMIQLDLFYIPQPRSAPENIKRLVELLHFLTARLSISVAPKLNLDIAAHYAAVILRGTGISSVFAIDSIRVPVPIDVRRGGTSLIANLAGARECSLFGMWQKPLTLQYTSVLYEQLEVPISAGGGFTDGLDAIEAIMLGATTVQFATAIIRQGHRQITKILDQMQSYMRQHDIASIEQIRGVAHKSFREEVYEPAKAVVNQDLCIRCGLCTRLVFCQDIHADQKGNVEIEATCDGCGLCPTVCPVPGALTLQPL